MADEEHDVYGGEIPEDAEGEYDLEGNPEEEGKEGEGAGGEGGSGDVDAAAKVRRVNLYSGSIICSALRILFVRNAIHQRRTAQSLLVIM